MRVHELAKKLGISSKDLLEKLKNLKVDAKSHMSVLEDDVAQLVEDELSGKAKKQAIPVVETPEVKPAAAPAPAPARSPPPPRRACF